MSLTPKQEKFAQAYVETGNSAEAYRRAYSTKNCTEKTVWEAGSRTLSISKVSARVKELQANVLKKHEVTVDKVINEYRKLAFLDTRKAFDENGHLKNIQDLDDDTAAAVAGIEFEEVFEGRGDDRSHVGTIHKIKLSDKIRALDSLAKHLGMFVDRVEVSGALTISDRLIAARKRLNRK